MASPASRKRLHDLVEDVLIVILIECDVAGVLALSETSRFFHHLAFTNTVWHSLVTELVQRGFIDRRSDDEDLKDLSTEQLIGIVKRILHGPKAWADKPSNSYSVALRRSLNLFRKLVRKPAVEAAAPLGEAKRIVLHPEIFQGPAMSPIVDNLWNRSKLLPGGKYVLFLNSARLECWSVFEDRLVWTHRPSMDLAWVHDFEVEMIECDLAVILTCQRIDPGKLFVEISTLDLKAGVSNLELVSWVPDNHFIPDFAHIDCVVCSDIVAVYMRRRMPTSQQITKDQKVDGGQKVDVGPQESVATRTIQNMATHLGSRRSGTVQLRMRETQRWDVLAFPLDHSAAHSDEAQRDGIVWAHPRSL